MAVELQSGLPSVHQFQSLIREKQQIEIKLVTNDVITGTLRWQDPSAFVWIATKAKR